MLLRLSLFIWTRQSVTFPAPNATLCSSTSAQYKGDFGWAGRVDTVSRQLEWMHRLRTLRIVQYRTSSRSVHFTICLWSASILSTVYSAEDRSNLEDKFLTAYLISPYIPVFALVQDRISDISTVRAQFGRCEGLRSPISLASLFAPFSNKSCIIS